MNHTPQDPIPLMTIDEVAEYLRLHPMTVRRLVRERQLPAFKVGRQWRIKRESLDRWVEEKTMQNDPASA